VDDFLMELMYFSYWCCFI